MLRGGLLAYDTCWKVSPEMQSPARLRSLTRSVLSVLLLVSGLSVLGAAPAAAAPTTCGGLIWQDYDGDGERLEDYSYISAEYAAIEDPGVEGITVTLTDSLGNVFVDTTDAAGVWSVVLDSASFPVRVDVSGYPSTWNPGVIGADSAPHTHFIDTASDCTGPFDGTGQPGNASIAAPGTFCENRPDIVTSCFLFGNAPDHDNLAAVVSLIDGAEDDLSTDSPNWQVCLLYTSPSPRDATLSRMPSSA